MFGNMVHHWRPSDNLEYSFRPGGWHLNDRGTLVGVIQYRRVNGKAMLRRLTREGALLCYADTSEDACDRLWEWHRRTRSSRRGA